MTPLETVQRLPEENRMPRSGPCGAVRSVKATSRLASGICSNVAAYHDPGQTKPLQPFLVPWTTSYSAK